MVERPLTLTGALTLEVALDASVVPEEDAVSDAWAAESVTDVVLEPVSVDEVDRLSVAEVVTVPPASVVVPVPLDVVEVAESTDVVVPLPVSAPAPPLEPLFDAFIVIVQVLTSSTAGCPLLSVIGVRVITHCCVIKPATVLVVCTVMMEVGAA
jgi:hypothetical protein